MAYQSPGRVGGMGKGGKVRPCGLDATQLRAIPFPHQHGYNSHKGVKRAQR
jgi:hypothetical protein